MLTRSFLKGMGITDEQISAIIEAHTESTDQSCLENKIYVKEVPPMYAQKAIVHNALTLHTVRNVHNAHCAYRFKVQSCDCINFVRVIEKNAIPITKPYKIERCMKTGRATYDEKKLWGI